MWHNKDSLCYDVFESDLAVFADISMSLNIGEKKNLAASSQVLNEKALSDKHIKWANRYLQGRYFLKMDCYLMNRPIKETKSLRTSTIVERFSLFRFFITFLYDLFVFILLQR